MPFYGVQQAIASVIERMWRAQATAGGLATTIEPGLCTCGECKPPPYKMPAAYGQRACFYFARCSHAAGIGCFSTCGPLISITGDSPCQSTQGVG